MDPALVGPTIPAPVALVSGTRWPRWPRWAVAVVGAWLALAGLSALLARLAGIPGPPCVFRWATSVPCPTCGTGRGTARLFAGDLLGALAHNPLFFGLLGLGLALLLVRVVSGRRLALALSPRGRAVCWGLGVALVVGNWLYLVIAGI